MARVCPVDSSYDLDTHKTDCEVLTQMQPMQYDKVLPTSDSCSAVCNLHLRTGFNGWAYM